MANLQKIKPCLWFDTEAEEAAKYYISIFPGSRLIQLFHYSDAGQSVHKMSPGGVMTVVFELNGQKFTGLNGGPLFRFNEAISLEVSCDTQDEIDYYWSKLAAGGEEGPCGWVKDKFGVSWQVVPTILREMLSDPDEKKTKRVTDSFMRMKKFDINTLKQAYTGKPLGHSHEAMK